MFNIVRRAAAFALFASLSVSPSLACSCGCGVFDVGAGSLLPSQPGGSIFLEYDFLDQNRNWSGGSRAPADDNEDKRIVSHFVTLGGRVMLNADWGFSVQLPYWSRRFTVDEGDGAQTFDHAAFGDVRLNVIYTGLSDDMTTGVTVGLKLATGDFRYPGFDRDTSIGTGSTDLLLGVFHRGSLTDDDRFTYFANAQWDKPFATQDGYEPGEEANAAIGVAYHSDSLAIGETQLTPVLQAIGTIRSRDRGVEASPGDTGYERLLLAPGLQIDAGRFSVYADVELPVAQNVNGNQLVAPALYRLTFSRSF